MDSTKLNSSTPKARGRQWEKLSWRPCGGCTGGTPSAFTKHWTTPPPPAGSRNLVPPHPARQCGVVKEAELNPGRFIRWILYVGTLSRELSLSILNTSQGRIPLISNRSSGVKAGVTSFSRSNDSIRRLLISIYALTRPSSNFIKVSIT